MVCVVTGLQQTSPGQGLGKEKDSDAPLLDSFITYQVISDVDIHHLQSSLMKLEQEDPSLHVVWDEELSELHIQLMGEIQLEVIQRLMKERFHIDVSFGPGSIVYRETIEGSVEGVGHFEPLRHYAEVHLLLESAPRGTGLSFESKVSEDLLAKNWQRLILTHLAEKPHLGVLIGAPLTDVRITLLAGRAHLKHTEGGDFRQSTYRAIRNALMYAESVLLEPICRFSLRAPQECYGRVMGDLTRMQVQPEPPEMGDTDFTLRGEAPFALFSTYNTDFLAATHGRGMLNYRLDHYAPCRDAESIIREAAYNPLADDTPDSVFCAKGAGYNVPWDQVRGHAHCPLEL